MSADNWIAIIKSKSGKFTGYNCCASISYKNEKDIRKRCTKYFEVDTVEEAIKEAQYCYSEYGYSFINLK